MHTTAVHNTQYDPTVAWNSFIPKPRHPAIRDVGAGGIPYFPWLPPLSPRGRR